MRASIRLVPYATHVSPPASWQHQLEGSWVQSAESAVPAETERPAASRWRGRGRGDVSAREKAPGSGMTVVGHADGKLASSSYKPAHVHEGILEGIGVCIGAPANRGQTQDTTGGHSQKKAVDCHGSIIALNAPLAPPPPPGRAPGDAPDRASPRWMSWSVFDKRWRNSSTTESGGRQGVGCRRGRAQ